MAERRDDIEAIRAGLRQSMPALAVRLAPGGGVSGVGYWPVNPARNDRHPGSFVIDIYGPTAGRFFDFAYPEMKGDAIDLIALLEFGMMPPDGRKDQDVWKWIRAWLSLPDQARAAPKIGRAVKAFHDPRPDEAKEQGAMRWWLGADKLVPGSIGWTYLKIARRIPLHQLARRPGAIRTQFNMKYNLEGPDKGKVFPGLLSCMTDGKGQIRAVHRTFLRGDGLGKAPVEKPKQMWPSPKGLSIRLTRGKTGRSPEECARRGECEDRQVLCEGIEDGLSWGVLYPDDRVAAVGASSLFKSTPLFDCAREFLIVADNDEILKSGKLDHMAREIKARAGGREVLITAPLDAKDVNEALQRARS